MVPVSLDWHSWFGGGVVVVVVGDRGAGSGGGGVGENSSLSSSVRGRVHVVPAPSEWHSWFGGGGLEGGGGLALDFVSDLDPGLESGGGGLESGGGGLESGGGGLESGGGGLESGGGGLESGGGGLESGGGGFGSGRGGLGSGCFCWPPPPVGVGASADLSGTAELSSHCPGVAAVGKKRLSGSWCSFQDPSDCCCCRANSIRPSSCLLATIRTTTSSPETLAVNDELSSHCPGVAVVGKKRLSGSWCSFQDPSDCCCCRANSIRPSSCLLATIRTAPSSDWLCTSPAVK